MARKRQSENALRRKVAADSEKQKEYGNIWQEIASGRKDLQNRFPEISFLEGAVGFNTNLFSYARRLVRLAEENENPIHKGSPNTPTQDGPGLIIKSFARPIFKDFEGKLADSLPSCVMSWALSIR